MNPTVQGAGKIACLVFWGVAITGLFVPALAMAAALGGIILAIHIVECVALVILYRDRSNALVADLAQVLLFGFFHLGAITRRPAATR